MAEVIGFALLSLVVMLVVAAVAGRAQSRSRCGLDESRRDLRMRAAFDEGGDVRPRSV